jgi:hypothetical protein
MGNLQVRFLEGWAPAMAPGHSTLIFGRRQVPICSFHYQHLSLDWETKRSYRHLRRHPITTFLLDFDDLTFS